MAQQKRSKVPSREEHLRLWQALPYKDRRRMLKAVNRGHGMDDRKEARIGVGVARQQQAYWRWAWVIGPLIGLVRVPEWSMVVVTALLGTALMVPFSIVRMRRARHAEQANLERLGVRPAAPKAG